MRMISASMGGATIGRYCHRATIALAVRTEVVREVIIETRCSGDVFDRRKPRRSVQCRGAPRMLDLLRDLIGFMSSRKKYWLTPIVIIMVLFGALVVLGQGSAIAPFIYAIF